MIKCFLFHTLGVTKDYSALELKNCMWSSTNGSIAIFSVDW